MCINRYIPDGTLKGGWVPIVRDKVVVDNVDGEHFMRSVEEPPDRINARKFRSRAITNNRMTT